jgi:ATP-dependent Clp protease ATP-binding subunit ClpC
MFERYTERARRVLFFARYECSSFGSTEIEPDHLLLGLMREIRQLFRPPYSPKDNVQEIRQQLEAQMFKGSNVST